MKVSTQMKSGMRNMNMKLTLLLFQPLSCKDAMYVPWAARECSFLRIHLNFWLAMICIVSSIENPIVHECINLPNLAQFSWLYMSIELPREDTTKAWVHNRPRANFTLWSPCWMVSLSVSSQVVLPSSIISDIFQHAWTCCRWSTDIVLFWCLWHCLRHPLCSFAVHGDLWDLICMRMWRVLARCHNRVISGRNADKYIELSLVPFLFVLFCLCFCFCFVFFFCLQSGIIMCTPTHQGTNGDVSMLL